MSTFRAAVAKWALPLVGLYLLIVGIMLLFGLSVPPVLLGVVALVAGLACLFAS